MIHMILQIENKTDKTVIKKMRTNVLYCLDTR